MLSGIESGACQSYYVIPRFSKFISHCWIGMDWMLYTKFSDLKGVHPFDRGVLSF